MSALHAKYREVKISLSVSSALPLFVDLSKTFQLSEPWFPHLENRNYNNHFYRVVLRIIRAIGQDFALKPGRGPEDECYCRCWSSQRAGVMS